MGQVFGWRLLGRQTQGMPLPSARHNNGNLIEFEIQWKFKVSLFKMSSANYNTILHTLCCCRGVCIFVISSIWNKQEYIRFPLNFEFDRNIVSGTDAWNSALMAQFAIYELPYNCLVNALKSGGAYLRQWTCSSLFHYRDVIMGAIASLSPASRLFTQSFIQALIKENIKAPHHWPLWGEFTGDRWIPRTKGQ